MRPALLALALLVAPAFAQPSPAGDPAGVVVAFYKAYAAQRPAGGGLPDATGRVRLQPVLSPRLNKQLADAAAAQARMATRVKAGGPKAALMPMLEGDIFTSQFEGATGWTIGPCQGDARQARCPVALIYQPRTGAGAEKPARWTDTVVLAATPGGWKVDDVVYDANFAAGNTGRLSDMLNMVIAANP